MFQRSRRVPAARRSPAIGSIESLEPRCLLSAALSVSRTLMVFNSVEPGVTGAGPSAAETLTLTNTGSSTLTLGSAALKIVNDPSITAQDASLFALLNASSVATALAPGASTNLQLDYTAQAVGRDSALLQIATNAPAGTTPITLHGIGTAGLGGQDEPSLARILRAYDIPTIVGMGPDDSNEGAGVYPVTPDPSSQEVLMPRLEKAGDGPIIITDLADFTSTAQPAIGLGYYVPGDPTDRTPLFFINKSDSQSADPTPQGATSFDPGAAPFSLYFQSSIKDAGQPRIGYSEDAFNTWDTTQQRKFRFFPLENADGSVVPNAFVLATTEFNAPIGYNFNDIVAIIRNVKAAADGPVLGLQNMDALPSTDRMVFNRIANPNPTFGNAVHDTGILEIHNSGDQTLQISSLSLDSSAWEIASPSSTSFMVAAGATASITLKFIATSVPASLPYNETDGTENPGKGGVYNGTLTITSNDPSNPTRTVQLAGWFQTSSEDSEEPSLQSIINLIGGYQTAINSTPIPELTEGANTPNSFGSEVRSDFWAAADPSFPVSVQQLDSYHSIGNPVTLAWYAQGGSTYTTLITIDADAGQELLPLASGSSNPAAASFSPTTAFAFRIDGFEYSNDSRNVAAGNTGGGGHQVRFFPVVDATGNIVPNEWIMALDYDVAGQENFDFQDNVYLISNMRPSIAAPTPTIFQAANTGSNVALQWSPVTDPTLMGYNVFSADSRGGSYTQLNTALISATTFSDTTIPAAGATAYYRVVAVDASGSGTAATATAFTPGSGIAIPGIPTGLEPTVISASEIDLTWQPVSNAASYTVEREDPGATSFSTIVSNLAAASYQDAMLTAQSTYSYRVIAVNSAGSSDPSGAVTAQTPGVGGGPTPQQQLAADQAARTGALAADHAAILSTHQAVAAQLLGLNTQLHADNHTLRLTLSADRAMLAAAQHTDHQAIGADKQKIRQDRSDPTALAADQTQLATDLAQLATDTAALRAHTAADKSSGQSTLATDHQSITSAHAAGHTQIVQLNATLQADTRHWRQVIRADKKAL